MINQSYLIIYLTRLNADTNHNKAEGKHFIPFLDIKSVDKTEAK
jgi:hypothetical protein